jgi:phenol 2-monooxygenase
MRLYVAPGDRLPPEAIVRLADWKPMNLQDLAPSDGLFKLLLFPGNILSPERKKHLESIANRLAKEIDTLPGSFLTIHTILHSDKTEISWKDVPSVLADSWERSVDVTTNNAR